MATKREDQAAEAVLAVGDIQAEIKEAEAEATWDQDLVVGVVRKAIGVEDPTAEVTKDLGVEIARGGDPEVGAKIGITRGEVQENITENMTEGNTTTTEAANTEKEVKVTRGVGHESDYWNDILIRICYVNL